MLSPRSRTSLFGRREACDPAPHTPLVETPTAPALANHKGLVNNAGLDVAFALATLSLPAVSHAVPHHVTTAMATAVAMPDPQRLARLFSSKPRIILGSASSSRRAIMDELARQHGFSYEVRTADIDEKAIRLPSPPELVTALAKAKADAIVEKLRASGEASHGLLVGAGCSGVGGGRRACHGVAWMCSCPGRQLAAASAAAALVL